MRRLALPLCFTTTLAATAFGQSFLNGIELEAQPAVVWTSALAQTPLAEDVVLAVISQSGRSAKARAALERQGFRVLAALPRDGYLVAVDRPDAASAALVAAADPAFRAMTVAPEWKIAPDFASVLASAPPGEDIGVAVFTSRPGLEAELAAVAAGHGASLTSRSESGKGRAGIRVPAQNLPALLTALADLPAVYNIQPAGGARLLNDSASEILQSGSPTGGRSIAAQGLQGTDQVIAILDSGLDWDSCFFRESDDSAPPTVSGTGIGSPDSSRRKVIVYDFLFSGDFAGGNGDFDNNGHGTYVAGNAAGSQITSPTGDASLNGIAPLAQLVIQDGGYTTDNNCSDMAGLGCPLIDITPILDQAVAQGAHLHNDSWGDRENFLPNNTYTATCVDMDDATWRNPGFLIFCAAGNSGPADNTVGSPSTAKNVLSIAAGQNQNSVFNNDPESITSFSSRGYAADGRFKPDLVAPGQTVSAFSDGNVTSNNCNILNPQGTSMASPLAAGAGALVREYFTDGFYPTGAALPGDAFVPSAALMKAVLINGAVDMTGVTGPVPNRAEGWGRIHLDNSLHFTGDDRTMLVVDEADIFDSSSNAPRQYTFSAGGNAAAGQLKVTLVYTDAPADPLASVSLVNDLNLTVTDGTDTWLGNNFDSVSGESVTGGAADALNNVEQVTLPASTTGTFTVSVTPAVIDVVDQGFALVIAGDVSNLQVTSVGDWRRAE